MAHPLEDERIGQIVESLQSKKGLDILLMDLRSSTDATDFFILCTATSSLQVKTLADEVADKLKEEGQRPWHIEGYKTRRWVLIDYVDIVVHIFQREAREFYALERLWGDAECTSFEDDLENALETGPNEDNQSVFSHS
jgi:ribosome-associated protein